LRYFTTDITYQLQQQQTRQENHQNLETYATRNFVNLYFNRSTGRFNIPKGGVLDQRFANSNAQTFRLQNNAAINWGANNNITALIGTEIRETRSESSSFRAYGYDPLLKTYVNVNFVDNFTIYNNIQNPRPIPNSSSFSQTTYRFFSLYSNAAYTKNNRYIVSLSARKDASNIFGVDANQKGIPLWSAGLAWIISKEPFYNSSWLPQLKFRASYGTNGNIDNTLAAVTTIRYITGAMYSMLPYAYVLNNPNPNLRWEKTKVLNFGVDFATKQNRIKGSIDLFAKNGTDLIGFAPIDPTTGIQNGGVYSYKGNVADMQGKGIELALTTINIKGWLEWTTTLLANYVSSKIKTYDITNINGQSFINQGLGVSPVPGSYVYSIYAYRWAGLDPATGDPMGFAQQGTSKDYNGLVNVPVTELAYKGSAVPLVFGSLMNTLHWKQFSVSANLLYKLGYWFMRPTVRYNDLFDGRNSHPDYLRRWQKPGDELATNVPSRTYPNLNINRDAFYGASEIHATKGDHIRLQDISLNWSFQPKSGKWINQITLYSYLNNLGIIWRANNHSIDPDYPEIGYPLPKTFALGCKITCK
jgi:TonB-dependent starch-binding outer membrane protein SusC